MHHTTLVLLPAISLALLDCRRKFLKKFSRGGWVGENLNGCLRLVGLAVVLHRSRRRGCIISHHRRGSHDRIYESPCSATLCGWMRTVGLSLAVLSARAPLAAELCGGGFVIAADALPLVVCGERGQCVLLITHILLLLYLFVLGGLVDLLGPLRVQLYVFVRCTVCWGLPLWVPLRTPASFLFAPLRPQSRTPNQAIGVITSCYVAGLC